MSSTSRTAKPKPLICDVAVAEKEHQQLDAGRRDQQHRPPARLDPEADRGKEAGEREEREIGEAGGTHRRERADLAAGDAEQARGVVEAEQQGDDRDDPDVAAGELEGEVPWRRM